VKKGIARWKPPEQTCGRGEKVCMITIYHAEALAEYRKGSDASLGSWVCGSEVSYRIIETEDERNSENIVGVPESSDQKGSLSSTSDRENVPPPLVSGLLYSR
jgi:hypothetical protein